MVGILPTPPYQSCLCWSSGPRGQEVPELLVLDPSRATAGGKFVSLGAAQTLEPLSWDVFTEVQSAGRQQRDPPGSQEAEEEARQRDQAFYIP